MGKEKRYLLRNWKRYMAVVLGITLTVAQLSIPATAAEGTEVKTGTETGLTAEGLCEHHTAHTDACGYKEAVKGQDCNHEHTDACYEEVTDCKHEHTDECYETQPAAEESAEEENPQKILNCTHVCSEGSGCIVKTLNCTHTHDDTCGFAAPVEGSPCTFVCTECGKTGTPQGPGGDNTQGEDGEQESPDRTEAVKNVQELIDALPSVDEVKAMNEEDRNAAYTRTQEANDAYEALSAEEQAQVDITKIEALFGYFNGQIANMAETSEYVAEVDGTYYTDFMAALAATCNTGVLVTGEGAKYCKLLKDVTVNGDVGSVGIDGQNSYYIDLNGKTLTCGTLYLGGARVSFLQGSGTVEGNIGIENGVFQLSGDIIVKGNILQESFSLLEMHGSGVFRVNGNIADFSQSSVIDNGVTIVCNGTCSETDITFYSPKDGSTLITEPSNLTATYGQRLSDISLPTVWEWVNKDTSVSVGTQSYPARFNTAGYEAEYDFTDVTGYDKTNHYVQRNLSVTVSKGATVLTITTESMDKTYDGHPAIEPSVSKTGSTKDVTFTWYEMSSEGSWVVLFSAPVNAGSYKVVAAVEADDNYNGVVRERIFTVRRATPEFTRPVGLTAVYGQRLAEVSLPSAFNGRFLWYEGSDAKVGDVGAHTFHWTFVPWDDTNFEDVFDQSVTITVTPKQLTDSMIAAIADQYYTGAAIEPDITVTDTAGIKKQDYIVSYSDNTNVGTATVTITGKNNYTGTASRTFTIKNIKAQVKTPSITPNGGEYTSDKLQVTMTCATEGATIYYTTDGTQPTTGSSRYQGAFEVTIPATVKAIAVKSGMADSEVASVSYTKNAQPTHSHSYNSSVTKQPTCTQSGERTYRCSCGASYTEKIDATGHLHTEIRDVREATCTKEGYTGNTVCKDCGTIITAGQTIARTRHTLSDWIVDRQPTKESEGSRHKECTICHTILLTGTIDKLPSSTDDNDNQGEGEKEPFIKGEDGKEGWPVIEEQIDDADDGDTVIVDMNGSTTVPGNIIESIAGKDITIVFDLGDGITWSVNGKSVTADNIKDIDFGVSRDTKNIPVDVINNVTGERYSMTITIEHDGEFGFTAVLTVNMEKKNAGLYANLFYYNKAAEELEFMCADEIDTDGNAELSFTHASDYTIVIDKEPMDGSGEKNAETGTDMTEAGEAEAQDSVPAVTATVESRKDIMDYLWIILLGAVVIVVGVGGYVYFIGKKKDDEAE